MKKILFGVAALGLLGLAGAGIGLKAQDAVEAKAEEEPVYYYLCGSFAGGYSTYSPADGWDNNNTTYPVKEGDVSPVVFNFKKYESDTNHGDEFKFVLKGTWDGALGYGKLLGTAKSCFGDSGGNLYCNVTGSYAVYVSDGNLYIDYADGTEFFLYGDDNSWTLGTGESAKVNGAGATYELTKDNKFRLTVASSNLGSIGIAQLPDKLYNCFADAGSDNNIFVKVGGEYVVTIAQADHNIRINIAFTNMDTGMVYVLDLNGNLLATNHYAHVYNAAGAETGWPGAAMTATAGASHIYEYEYMKVMENVIFNNNETENVAQSLAGKDGKCFILSWDYDDPAGKWVSSTWVSLEAAKFIDNYMKFDVHHENGGAGTGLCASEGWYSAAKAAYGKLSSDSKADVCGYTRVGDRLAAWAEANGDTFTVTDGVGSFGEAKNVSHYEMASNDNNAVTIAVIVTSATVLGAGVFFFARKRRAE